VPPTSWPLTQARPERRVLRRRLAASVCATRRSTAARCSSPRRRAAHSDGLLVVIAPLLRCPLFWLRAEGRGLEPSAFNQIGTKPPGRWGNARRGTAPAPQSKPVTPASRLVAHSAVGGIRLGLSVMAAGPARVPHYSYCGRLCARISKRGPRATTVGASSPLALLVRSESSRRLGARKPARSLSLRRLAIRPLLVRHGVITTRPNALRPSEYPCVSAASANGNDLSISTCSSPLATRSSRSKILPGGRPPRLLGGTADGGDDGGEPTPSARVAALGTQP
jgi:hypothetical protein